MQPFVDAARPRRAIFGAGALAYLADEIARLDLERVNDLSTPRPLADAQRLAADPSWNPRALDHEGIKQLIAWTGGWPGGSPSIRKRPLKKRGAREKTTWVT